MDEAQFQDLGSAPATVEASRLCILKGLIKGNRVEQADAQQAYIQCDLLGDETWVEIPKDLQPEDWKRFNDPVCILRKSLYGHPDSGLLGGTL